jgi:hypothetical protein
MPRIVAARRAPASIQYSPVANTVWRGLADFSSHFYTKRVQTVAAAGRRISVNADDSRRRIAPRGAVVAAALLGSFSLSPTVASD